MSCAIIQNSDWYGQLVISSAAPAPPARRGWCTVSRRCWRPRGGGRKKERVDVEEPRGRPRRSAQLKSGRLREALVELIREPSRARACRPSASSARPTTSRGRPSGPCCAARDRAADLPAPGEGHIRRAGEARAAPRAHEPHRGDARQRHPPGLEADQRDAPAGRRRDRRRAAPRPQCRGAPDRAAASRRRRADRDRGALPEREPLRRHHGRARRQRLLLPAAPLRLRRRARLRRGDDRGGGRRPARGRAAELRCRLGAAAALAPDARHGGPPDRVRALALPR